MNDTSHPHSFMVARLAISLLCLLFIVPHAHPQDEPAPLYALPNAFDTPPPVTSTTMTITTRGRLILANPISHSVAIVDPLNRRLDLEIPVGTEPHHVALTPDNMRLIVANQGTQTLTVINTTDWQPIAEIPVGAPPHGIVADATSVYVARPQRADVLRVDITTGAHLEIIPTPADPIGLALWGEFLYVTHLWAGQVSLIYRPASQVIQTLQLHPQASHAHTLTIDARQGLAYVPHTISNTSATFPDQALLPRISVIDLARFRLLPSRTIDLTLADRWLNLPHALTLDATQNTLFIVSSASNALTLLERNASTARAHLPTDSAPRAVIAGRDGISIYVHNTIAQTVTFYETRFNTQTDTIPTSTLSDPTQTLARRAFETTRQPLIPACAACHYQGMSDGRTWADRPTPDLRYLSDDTAYDTLTPHPFPHASDQLGALPPDPLETLALIQYLRDLAQNPPLIQD